ncbi:MAG: BMP family ABC transporter substrate-binding protein [Thermodesulfobacteriota bacterium]
MIRVQRIQPIHFFYGLVLFIGLCFFPFKEAFSASKPAYNVCLALGAGGLGDRAFNDSAYEGLYKANRELGIRFRVVEYRGKSEQVFNLFQAAQEGYDLIIGIGFENGPPIKEVAVKFPRMKFALIDTSIEGPNISSVVFRELEADFLAGALCALLSATGTVGFLGGADIPVIRRIEFGWRQGILYIDPKTSVVSEYAGGRDDFSAFNKPDLGQKLAEKMLQGQADIIYAAAGGTDLGAIRAAQERKKMIITTGTDRRWMAPEAVIASRIKNVDVAVYKLLEELKADRLKAGVKILDLKTGGVGITELKHKKVPIEIREKIADLYQKVVSGKIKIKEFPAE